MVGVDKSVMVKAIFLYLTICVLLSICQFARCNQIEIVSLTIYMRSVQLIGYIFIKPVHSVFVFLSFHEFFFGWLLGSFAIRSEVELKYFTSFLFCDS